MKQFMVSQAEIWLFACFWAEGLRTLISPKNLIPRQALGELDRMNYWISLYNYDQSLREYQSRKEPEKIMVDLTQDEVTILMRRAGGLLMADLDSGRVTVQTQKCIDRLVELVALIEPQKPYSGGDGG